MYEKGLGLGWSQEPGNAVLCFSAYSNKEGVTLVTQASLANQNLQSEH